MSNDTFTDLAKQLNIPVDTLQKESLKFYIEDKLKKLKIERLQILSKYNIRNLDDMERLYQSEKVRERDSWEDFFTLQHLDSEIDLLEKTAATFNV